MSGGQANETIAEPDAASANQAAGNEEVKVEEIGTIERDKHGEPAPDIAFESPTGAQVTLASFRGKPVLLNLWATWCAPCLKEMPSLDALAVSMGDSITVLTVAQDTKNPEKLVDGYFQKHAYKKLQPYLDRSASLSLTQGLNLPTTILYDSQGREVWRMLGGMDWTSETAREFIAEAS